VLLAFYQHSTKTTSILSKKGGNRPDRFRPCGTQPNGRTNYHHIPIPISGLTVEAIGGTAKDKGKNIFALGLIARCSI